MKKRVERLRGMYDVLPDIYLHQHEVIHQLQAFLTLAGYSPVDTPILERGDLYLASFGQELWQNLYTFRLHQRDLCLRPEYTASICRLLLDHYQQAPLPLRFQYAGPVFRYEAPGRGRYRQHTQLGIELFGGNGIAPDAEILQLACEALHTLGISTYRLELGHIGVASRFISSLQLDEQAARLLLSLMEQISRSEEGEQLARERIESLYPSENDALARFTNGESANTAFLAQLLSGISVFDAQTANRQEIIERFLWKLGRNEQRQQMMRALEFLRELHGISGSPPGAFEALRDLLARYKLDDGPVLELERLLALLEQSNVPSSQILLNLALGRGVSYYTGLVFEIHALDGYDTQLCGGGRYDSLMRAVGSSRDMKACGFAFGIERLLPLIPGNLPEPQPATALVIPVHNNDFPYALEIGRALRQQGVRTEVDLNGHGVWSGLKYAANQSIRFAFIVGESERQANVVTMRNLTTGKEQRLTLNELGSSILERENAR